MKSFKQYLNEAKIDPSAAGLADSAIRFENMGGGINVKVYPLMSIGFHGNDVYETLSLNTFSSGSVEFRTTNSEIGKWGDWKNLDDKTQKEYLNKVKKNSIDFAKKLEKLANEFDKKVFELAKKSGYEVKED